MVSVYMNPENLERKIADLKAFADSVKEHNDTVNKMYNNEPIEIGGDYLKPIQTAIDDAAAAIEVHAKDLGDCKTTMVNLNSNGVATHDLGGGISIEVPDDSAGLETTDKFQKWAQGATDVNDLTHPSRDGKTPSGRKHSEVIKSMKANQGDSTYANSVIDKIGPKNITDSIDGIASSAFSPQHEKGVVFARKEICQLFGGVLATASQTWDKDKSEKMSQAITSSVSPEEGRENWRRIPYLNAMLGGKDSDGNHVNDLKFGKDFLVSMGDMLEKVPWDENRKYYKEPGSQLQKQRLGSGIMTTDNQWSYDPLSGVLDAMGNNPEAAVQFLAPYDHDRSTYDNGGPKADTSRLDRLLKRDWEPDGYSGLTGAIAAASSMRASDSAATRESADQIAGRSIHFLAQNSTTSSVGEKDLYSMPDTKARVGMLLANCAPEVTEAWNSGNPTDIFSKKQLPAASADDIDRLAYQVSDNADATATISAGLGEYSRNCSQGGVAKNAGNRDMQISAINDAYRRGGNAINHLVGIADARAGEINDNNKADYDAKSANASAAVNVFFDVATTGLDSVGGPVTKVMASPVTEVATSTVKTLVTPVIVDSIVGERKKEVFSPVDSKALLNMRAAAIRDAANADLLKQDDFKENEMLASKFTVKDGDKYRIDLSKGATPQDVITWADSVSANSGDPVFAKLRDDSDGQAAQARNAGWDAAEEVRRNPR